MKAKKVILIVSIIAILLAVTIVIKILVLQNNLNPIIDVPEGLATVFEEKERDTGVYQENGGDVLYIADNSGKGKGCEVVKHFDNDDVLMQINKRTFKPLKQGNALIAVDEYFCDDYFGSRLFEISVDENLNINYEQRRVDYFSRYEDYLWYLSSATVEKIEDVITLQEKENEELAYEFENVYGVLNKCDEPNTTDMIKLSIDYSARKEEYYISEDRITYLGVNHDDDSSQWYEFTPDKCCNLDKINELLNELLNN